MSTKVVGQGDREQGVTPSSLCENNSKSTRNDGNNTSCCSEKGVVCVHREKT